MKTSTRKPHVGAGDPPAQVLKCQTGNPVATVVERKRAQDNPCGGNNPCEGDSPCERDSPWEGDSPCVKETAHGKETARVGAGDPPAQVFAGSREPRISVSAALLALRSAPTVLKGRLQPRRNPPIGERHRTDHQPPAPKGAAQCSPGRKSGVSSQKRNQVPEGRQKLSRAPCTLDRCNNAPGLLPLDQGSPCGSGRPARSGFCRRQRASDFGQRSTSSAAIPPSCPERARLQPRRTPPIGERHRTDHQTPAPTGAA
jgi:hypothetical protein